MYQKVILMFLPKHAALFLSIAMRNIQGHNLRSLHSNNQEKNCANCANIQTLLHFVFFCFVYPHILQTKKKNTEVDVSL